jgi:hypothetical protein
MTCAQLMGLASLKAVSPTPVSSAPAPAPANWRHPTACRISYCKKEPFRSVPILAKISSELACDAVNENPQLVQPREGAYCGSIATGVENQAELVSGCH